MADWRRLTRQQSALDKKSGQQAVTGGLLQSILGHSRRDGNPRNNRVIATKVRVDGYGVTALRLEINMAKKKEKAARPLSANALDAVRKTRWGKAQAIVERLVATIDHRPEQECLECKYRVDEVKWIGWPDLEPVTRSATDWLLLSMAAYDEFELKRIEDNLRTKGKWHLWQDQDPREATSPENQNSRTSSAKSVANPG